METYQGKTTGEILNVEKINVMTQSRYGTKIYTDSYKITYRYRVGDSLMQDTDIVHVTQRNQKLLSRILSQPNPAIEIRFDIEAPEKSILSPAE